jgi:peptidylprolyl isomerase
VSSRPPSSNRRAGPLAKPRRTALTVLIIVIVLLFGFGTVIALLVGSGSGGRDTSSSTRGTTASIPAVASAKGKPCVATTGALPPGAPAVPVPVGPPPTQLVTQDLQAGTGAAVNPGATVTVDYIGVACSTGAVFDSSYTSGQPVTFSLSQVIPGWQQGIPGMKIGGSRLLGIPPDQAYGDQGAPPKIAPGETLWFVVSVHAAQ